MLNLCIIVKNKISTSGEAIIKFSSSFLAREGEGIGVMSTKREICHRKSDAIAENLNLSEGFMEEVTSELVLIVEYGRVKWKSRVVERATHMGQSFRKMLVSVFPMKAPKTQAYKL